MTNKEMGFSEGLEKVQNDAKKSIVTCHHALVHNPFVWKEDEVLAVEKVKNDTKNSIVTCHHALVHNPFLWNEEN
jgi:4-hydroxy-3-methylbut-2-enyl diphosphate reductase IspH